MGVKRLRSADRMLGVIDAIAATQPIGVGALAAMLGDDKSAIQRALMTLADSGWIRPVGTPTKWELTSKVLVIAEQTRAAQSLARIARPAMEALREQTSETVILAIAEAGRVTILDVAESPQLVRTAPHVGMVIPTESSAAGLAILAALPAPDATALLGREPDATLGKEITRTHRQGYSVNLRWEGSTSVGAAIHTPTGDVVGALAVAAPTERFPAARQRRYGTMVAEQCRALCGQVGKTDRR